MCEDNDECRSEGDQICGAGGTFVECVNIEGGFNCSCAPGYRAAVSEECVNVDECSENSLEATCGDNSTSCDDREGSFQCHCSEGYNATEGSPCVDVDECQEETCDSIGTCVNTDGSFYCSCFAGYETDDVSGYCKDVDECEEFDIECGPEDASNCTNLVGSYRCDCGPTGLWPGSGLKCQCNESTYSSS